MMDKEKYLANPSCCPHCESPLISLTSDFHGEGDFGDQHKVWSYMECETCGRMWIDNYRLVGVVEVGDLIMHRDETGKYLVVFSRRAKTWLDENWKNPQEWNGNLFRPADFDSALEVLKKADLAVEEVKQEA